MATKSARRRGDAGVPEIKTVAERSGNPQIPNKAFVAAEELLGRPASVVAAILHKRFGVKAFSLTADDVKAAADELKKLVNEPDADAPMSRRIEDYIGPEAEERWRAKAYGEVNTRILLKRLQELFSDQPGGPKASEAELAKLVKETKDEHDAYMALLDRKPEEGAPAFACMWVGHRGKNEKIVRQTTRKLRRGEDGQLAPVTFEEDGAVKEARRGDFIVDPGSGEIFCSCDGCKKAVAESLLPQLKSLKDERGRRLYGDDYIAKALSWKTFAHAKRISDAIRRKAEGVTSFVSGFGKPAGGFNQSLREQLRGGQRFGRE